MKEDASVESWARQKEVATRRRRHYRRYMYRRDWQSSEIDKDRDIP